MKKITSVSLTSSLMGAAVQFLKNESMDCLVTQDGMVKLIKQLVNYKEEGKELYPEIYIFDDVEMIMKILPFSQHYYIGVGGRDSRTMLKALKKCAPLTEGDGGWSIFINRTNENQIEYGVFRAGTSLLSVSISDSLIFSDDEIEEVKAILIRQISDKLIEVSGMGNETLLISFGGNDEKDSSPIENQLKFVSSIVENVPVEIRERVSGFYKKIFDEVLKKGHGTLACVIDHKRKTLSKKLSDGIVLRNRIDVSKTVKALSDKNDLQANSELIGNFSLISGMMQSDGITIFTDKGEVAAYNIFVKHPQSIAKTNVSGGARSRTFMTLKNWIGSGIKGAYIQSQDGKIEYQLKDGK